ncbi:Stage V sporulation protein AC (SpoVAC) [Lachnospiraceae bacterium TWA4]|nr:Stage V sporulation protein AC (SpoVAC) [Lachnospiraceae bacterium TWA4]
MNKEEYNEYVKQVTPTNNTWIDVIKAFLGGGAICLFAELINDGFQNYFGMIEDVSRVYTLIVLILITVILTGFGLFAKIVKHIGAGALVPITGFANSVAAAAIEYKNEGNVFGVGCKIFIIAGPVILFGVFTSWILGIIYWIGLQIGMIA